MEHRGGTRRTIDAKVTIDCRPVGLMHGRIQNISAGGLYIKMRPLRAMKNDNVKIVLLQRRGTVRRVHRISAVVIRWGNDGAGLMFSRLPPNAFYTLLALLLAEEQRRPGSSSRGVGRGSISAAHRTRGTWSNNKYDS